MPASFSITAWAALRGLNQSRAIAACFVLMGRCRALPSKPTNRSMPKRRRVARMSDKAIRVSHDWAGNPRTSILAWWAPRAAIIVALLAPVPLRAAVWSTALLWMGAACILNAQRCGRTHCRYTGPFYLAMIVPITLFASGVISANIYGSLTLGLFIIAGGWIIWWATELAWGKFS